MEAALAFKKTHGRTRLTESEIDALSVDKARDTIRILQFVLDEALGADPLESLGNKAYKFFRDYRRAGATWKQPGNGYRRALSPVQRRVIACLILGRGERKRLFGAVYADRIAQGNEPASFKSLEVLLCHARAPLAAAGFAVRSIYGWGYELDRAAELKDMINAHAERGFDFKTLKPIRPNYAARGPKGAVE